MFYGCTGIENATVNFNNLGTYSDTTVSQVLSQMFDGCTNLITARIQQSPLVTGKVPLGAFTNMFDNCPNLETVYLLFYTGSTYPTKLSQFGNPIVGGNTKNGNLYIIYNDTYPLSFIEEAIPSTWTWHKQA